MFYHTVFSSAESLDNMLDAQLKRIEGVGKEILKAMQTTTRSIRDNSKKLKLIKSLKTAFEQLKKQKENQKALVFMENKK